MRVRPESGRAIDGAVVGFAYGAILSFLSLGAAGAGHGSLVPLYLSSAPLGVLRFFGEAGFYAAFVGGAPVVWAILEGHGYRLIETGMQNRLFLRRPSAVDDCTAFHFHIVEQCTWDERRERLMRDYLLAHSDAVAAYAALKIELARYAEDSLAYTKAKRLIAVPKPRPSARFPRLRDRAGAVQADSESQSPGGHVVPIPLLAGF